MSSFHCVNSLPKYLSDMAICKFVTTFFCAILPFVSLHSSTLHSWNNGQSSSVSIIVHLIISQRWEILQTFLPQQSNSVLPYAHSMGQAIQHPSSSTIRPSLGTVVNPIIQTPMSHRNGRASTKLSRWKPECYLRGSILGLNVINECCLSISISLSHSGHRDDFVWHQYRDLSLAHRGFWEYLCILLQKGLISPRFNQINTPEIENL